MAIKSLVNNAWEDVEDMRTDNNGTYESADHINAMVVGAWEEVWSSGYKISFACIVGSSMSGNIYGDVDNGTYYIPDGYSATIKPESSSYHSFKVYLYISDVNFAAGTSHTITFDDDLSSSISYDFRPDAYDATTYASYAKNTNSHSVTFTASKACTNLCWSIGYGEMTISNVYVDGKRCKFI